VRQIQGRDYQCTQILGIFATNSMLDSFKLVITSLV